MVVLGRVCYVLLFGSGFVRVSSIVALPSPCVGGWPGFVRCLVIEQQLYGLGG